MSACRSPSSIFTGYGLAGCGGDQMFVYNLYLLQMVIPAMLILLPQFLIIQWVFKLFRDMAAGAVAVGRP